MILSLQAGDWAAITILIIVVGSVLGGMVKFYQAIRVLRKGRPEIEPELAQQQEQEFKNNEQDD